MIAISSLYLGFHLPPCNVNPFHPISLLKPYHLFSLPLNKIYFSKIGKQLLWLSLASGDYVQKSLSSQSLKFRWGRGSVSLSFSGWRCPSPKPFQVQCLSTQRVAHNGSQYMDVAIIVIIIRHGFETLTCREPAWEFPPMTKVMQRGLICKGESGLKGPPGSAWASTPKPESVCVTILWLFPTPLTLMGGHPRPPFSEGNQLRALVN